jgi:hypothetical protein
VRKDFFDRFRLMMKRFGEFGRILVSVNVKGGGFFFGVDKVVDVLFSFHFLKDKEFIRKEKTK